MITKTIDAQISAQRMQAITVLRDDFGHEFIVQTNLADPNVSHADDVARAITTMSTNEATFVAHLQQMGMSAEQIDAMKA